MFSAASLWTKWLLFIIQLATPVHICRNRVCTSSSVNISLTVLHEHGQGSAASPWFSALVSSGLFYTTKKHFITLAFSEGHCTKSEAYHTAPEHSRKTDKHSYGKEFWVKPVFCDVSLHFPYLCQVLVHCQVADSSQKFWTPTSENLLATLALSDLSLIGVEWWVKIHFELKKGLFYSFKGNFCFIKT